MKRLATQLIVLVLAAVAPPVSAQEAPVGESASISVTVDPRIELLAVVQLSSGYGGRASQVLTRYDFTYKKHVELQFSTYRDHPVMGLFNDMSRRGFSFDAPVAAIVHYSDPPALQPIAPLPDDVIRRAGGREQLDDFIEALRDFCRTSFFLEFYEQHRPFYDTILAKARTKIESIDVSVVESYYGTAHRSYNIVLSPLFHPGGYGPRVVRDDGEVDIYSVNGPLSVEGEADPVPVFGGVDDFRYLVWHEFSHSFINPLVDTYAERVDACEPLFEPMREVMFRQAYRQWRTCVYEHIVRAVTCRLAFLEGGMNAGIAAMREESSRGFRYVQPLCEALKRYEGDRETYPTLADFFEELIKVFEAAMVDDDQ